MQNCIIYTYLLFYDTTWLLNCESLRYKTSASLILSSFQILPIEDTEKHAIVAKETCSDISRRIKKESDLASPLQIVQMDLGISECIQVGEYFIASDRVGKNNARI